MIKKDAFDEKKAAVVKLLNDFGFMTKAQILYFVGDDTLGGQVISSLKSEHRILPLADTEYFTTDECMLDDYKKDPFTVGIHSRMLWIYLEFLCKYGAGEYALCTDSSIYLTFECGGQLVDVLYVRLNTEDETNRHFRMVERYLPPEERDQLKRIVLIDLKKQIPNIKITGTYAYALWNEDAGKVRYVKPMEE